MKLGRAHVERVADDGTLPYGGFLTKVELRLPMPADVQRVIYGRDLNNGALGIPNMDYEAPRYRLECRVVGPDGDVPFEAAAVWREVEP